MTNVAMSSLEERIALAFTAETNSRAVAGLINEADAAAAESDDAAGCARTRALDPALTTTEVAIARREMEDAAFRRDRFQEALRRLSERLRERRRLIYEKAKARRDEVAAELGNTYQPLTAQLAELVARVEASDREIERINDRGLPDGAKRLAPAELLARGLRSFVDKTGDVPQITKQLRLPAFRYEPHDRYAWPRPQEAVMVGGSVPRGTAIAARQ